MPWLALGVDAFLNVAGEVVIHDGIRASGPEIGDDFGDHPPAWLRRPEDGDRPVILFDHDFEAMLHFRERRVQVAGDFCFAHMTVGILSIILAAASYMYIPPFTSST
jgi:hypothetical protein